MAQHSFYDHGLDASSDIAEFESIRPSPLSETVPLFGAGTRSSTWPMFRNGSHDVGSQDIMEDYDSGVDDHTRDAELDPSDPGTTKPLIFEAIDPPTGYTPLTFRPKILTRRILLVIAVFYLSIFGLLGYLIYRSWFEQEWTIRNVNYYLAARYLPAVIGVCTNALFSTTTSTLRRILPFTHLADQKKKTNKYRLEHTVCARYFPLTQRFDWKIAFLVFGNLTVHFTIAAKATLFNVEDTGRGVWRVSVRLGSAVFLSFTYLLATSINVFIMIRYAGRNTGLKEKWDPTSLADIILLFTPADSVPKLSHALDYIDWYGMVRKSKAKYRLGYWKITNTIEPTPPIVYGIREIGAVTPTNGTKHLQRFNNYMDQKTPLAPCCRHSDRLGQLHDQPLVRYSSTEAYDAPCDRQHHPRCSHYPYRRGPFIYGAFWHILQVLLLATIVACLTFALIRIWCFQGIVLHKGPWLIQSNDITPAPNGTRFVTPGIEVITVPDSFGRRDKPAMIRDSVAVLLLRFLPISILGWAGASITIADIHHRWVQPFTNMYEKPSPASDSLLLDYMTVSPLDVIPQAWARNHFRVVYFGVLSALNWVPPLIITGLCAITETGSGVVVQLSPTAACSAIIWSSIYIYSLTSFWPPPTRRLPRDVASLYDLYCFFYDSQLRWYPEFAGAAFSKDITKDELHSQLRLIRDKFGFGLVGESHERHPGFDSVDHVTWIAPIPGVLGRMKNMFKRRKDRSNLSDHGSDSDSESDAIPLEDFNTSTSTHHRGTSVRGTTQTLGHSTAVD